MMPRVIGASLSLVVLLTIVLGSADRASGQEVVRIAAVVNSEAISIPDLVARIDVAIVASRLQASGELRRRLAPQVLRSMIDERLKVQEAERLGVTVGGAELAQARRAVEERNGIDAGGFDAFLRSQGLDASTVSDQLRAEILWSKLVRGRLGPSVSVGEGEIDEALARLEANRGRPEYRVAEIFLPVESGDRENEVLAAATSLYEQLAAGAGFAQIARQFSQSATAAVGGDIGWVVEGRLPSEIEAQLARMEPGSIAPPVRAFDGYYIVSLIDRRTVLSADASAGPDRNAVRQEIAGRRLGMLARRYVRDLHRSAFIDIRI
jgi:peptidyl-prolyl cis-trans isomerase SurA